MNKVVQAGQIVYIKDEFYTDNNLSVMEVPRYSWRVVKLDGNIATCEFQRRGKNSVMTLTIEMKYLRIEMI
jgi:predicted FMN-binding regulatory protein PaiB